MSPLLVGILLFGALGGLSLSAVYFLVEAPAGRRARRARLEALQRGFAAPAEPDQKPARGVRKPRAGGLRLPAAAAVDRLLQQAGLDYAAETLHVLCAALGTTGFVFALAAGQPLGFALLLAAAAAALPLGYVQVRRSRRLARFEEQFPEAIDLLGRAVRAGHAFTTGFELIADEMADPLASEFRTVFEQQNLGLPLRDALAHLVERVPSADVKVFVSALQIQRETGGNLAEILEKLSHVVRERFKLQRQIRVFTAEGRISMMVLTGAPLVAFLGMYTLNRSYITPLLVDPTGQRLALGAVVLLILGFLVIRRMIDMKV